jgi:hypothetical protein
MDKILFVTDAQHLSNKAMDFAGFICQLSRSGLTGIFLGNAAAGGFKKACEARSIKGTLYAEEAVSREAVIAESRYADLVLLPADGQLFAGAGCPVVVMPAHFEGLDQLIFIYDGEPAGVHAIKQFTYLFPELKDLPLQVICAREIEAPLKGWLTDHYRDVVITRHSGDGLRELVAGKERSFIVVSEAVPAKRVANQALFILN